MTYLQALILGMIQGATEFLPVSSSGHLVLVPWLVGWQVAGESNLAFDALVHWGTLAAVLIYFRRDLWRILLAMVDGLRTRDPLGQVDSRLGWLILVSNVPAGLAGLLFGEWFERIFERPQVAAIFLLVTAGALLYAERVGGSAEAGESIETLTWKSALLIGCAQVVAIFPGMSRSGATIAAGLLVGLRRSDATRFSFLVGVPIFVGAGALQLIDLGSMPEFQFDILFTGLIAAAIVGLLAIHTMLLIVRRRSLHPFAAYCALLGIASLVVYVLRG